MALPKKVEERFSRELPRFQRVLASARDRDINEADTVHIVKDILADVMGFDKYSEITSEFSIRGTYCDLAVKIDGAVKFLIEVKAIGLSLKENHLRQALDYGANYGIDWIVLTNGVRWIVHKVRFERPVSSDEVCAMDLLEMSARRQADQEKLFLLSREGIAKSAIEDFHSHVQVVNRFMIAQTVISQPVLEVIRRELKRVSPGMRADLGEIETILQNEVLKRDVLECDEANQAKQLMRRAATRVLRKTKDGAPSSDCNAEGKSSKQEISPDAECYDGGSAEAPPEPS